MPRVAAILVAHDSGRHLGCAVEALVAQTTPPDRIVVVDNASVDGAAESVARRLDGIEVIRLPRNVGFAAANNIAVDHVDDCEWVALVNPDAVPASDWLEQLLLASEKHPEYAAFATRLVAAEDPDVLDGAGDAYHVSGFAWRRSHGRRTPATGTHEVFSVCAAAALYRRDAFLSVDGFDESFFCYFEDTDLAFRLRLAGHRCLYVGSAVAVHAGSTSTGRTSDFTLFHQQRNCTRTFVKDMPWPLALTYLPEHVLVQLLALGWAATRGRGRVVLRAQAAAVRELPELLRRRRDVQRGRVVGALELRREMARGLSGYRIGLERALRLART